MEHNVERLSSTAVKVTATVTPEEMAPVIDAEFKELAKQVNIPGFRRGKAPRRILEQRFGIEAVLGQAYDRHINQHFAEIIEAAEVEPAAQPQLTEFTPSEDRGYTVEFTVPVYNDFEVPDFSAINVTVPELQLEESAVDERIQQIARRFGTLATVDRAAADDDLVVVGIEAKDEEGNINETVSVEKFSIRLGSGNGMIPGLEEALVGKKAGDEVTVDFTAGDEKLNVTATVQQVQETVLPEINDEFAEDAGADSLEELKEEVRSDLEAQAKLEQASAIRDAAMKEALAQAAIEVPEAVLEEAREQAVQQYGGKDQFEVFAESQENKDEFIAKFEADLKERAQMNALLDAIVKRDEITVSQAQLVDHVEALASQFGMSSDQLFNALIQSNQLNQVFVDAGRGVALRSVLVQVKAKDEAGKELDVVDYFGEEAAEENEAEATTETAAE